MTESHSKLADALEARADAEEAARLAEQATIRAENLMAAIERISAVLNDQSLGTRTRVRQARLVLADLDRDGANARLDAAVERFEANRAMGTKYALHRALLDWNRGEA